MFVAIRTPQGPRDQYVFGPFGSDEKARNWIVEYVCNTEGQVLVGEHAGGQPDVEALGWTVHEVEWVDEDGEVEEPVQLFDEPVQPEPTPIEIFSPLQRAVIEVGWPRHLSLQGI